MLPRLYDLITEHLDRTESAIDPHNQLRAIVVPRETDWSAEIVSALGRSCVVESSLDTFRDRMKFVRLAVPARHRIHEPSACS